MCVRVGIVHLAADGDAPVARADREPDIERDRRGDDDDVGEAELVPDDAGGQRELHHRRRRVQDDVADDVLDPRRAALDDPGKAARPPLQVEAQRKPVEVHEGAECELPHRMQPDAGKERVAELCEPGRDHAPEIVGQHERHRSRDDERQEAWGTGLTVQRVGCPFVGIGDEDRHHLRREERGEGDRDPHLQVGPVCRPHERPKMQDGREGAASVGRDFRGCRLRHQRASRAEALFAAMATRSTIPSRSPRSSAKAAGLST